MLKFNFKNLKTMKKNMLDLAGLGLFMCLNSACSKWLDEHPKAVAAETFYNTQKKLPPRCLPH